MLNSIQLNTTSCSRAELTEKISKIGQTDPALASQLSLSLLKKKSSLFTGSENETSNFLKSHDLCLKVTKPSLLGGGDEGGDEGGDGGGDGGGDDDGGILNAAKKKILGKLMDKGVDFASGLIADAVHCDWKGNLAQVKALCAKPGEPIPASMTVQGCKVKGEFKGEVSKVQQGGCCIPSFGIDANGQGKFTGTHDDIGNVFYSGNFCKFKFDDDSGNAEYIVEDIMHYTGCFVKGKKVGVAKVQRMCLETEKFFLYFEGEYLDDVMFNGVVFDPKGEEVCYMIDGSVGPAMGDRPKMTGGKKGKKNAVVPY